MFAIFGKFCRKSCFCRLSFIPFQTLDFSSKICYIDYANILISRKGVPLVKTYSLPFRGKDIRNIESRVFRALTMGALFLLGCNYEKKIFIIDCVNVICYLMLGNICLQFHCKV